MPDRRTCLVTGASGGIGRAVALRLGAAGHQVALTARREQPLQRTAELIGGGLVLPADLTDPTELARLFDDVEGALGPVEVLISASGAGESAPLHRTDDELWARMLELNLTAPFRCLRRAVPAMVDAGWGRVVVVASVAARIGEPYLAAYTAAKHGVLGLVRAAAAELAGTGVTVNAVCPGYVDTPMTDRTVAGIRSRTGRSEVEVRTLLAGKQPIGRLVTPEEVAEVAVACLGNGALTGQGLNVDGGTVQS